MISKQAFILLPSRLLLFLLFQLIIALILDSFENSSRYWLVSASLTNFVSIALLVYLFKIEGLRFQDIFRFEHKHLKKDILLFLGIALICMPLVFLPNYFLSICLWDDAEIPYGMMFQPISLPLVYVLLFVFPVSIAFAELATYFVYIMPRLKSAFKTKWLAVLLPVLFLSIQHITLPFLPDAKYIVYRALMFLPFALLIGITLYFRPRLFPFFAILHGLLDLGTVFVLLEISGGF